MGKPKIDVNPAGALTVLSVSPFSEDHSSLEAIIAPSKCIVLKAEKLPAARALLQKHDISVVICECDLSSGKWTDILAHIQPMRNPPSLIVTSRLADDRLWSLALNLGAWDVLAKPFDQNEVQRSVRSAWQHRHDLIELAAKPRRIAAPGS